MGTLIVLTFLSQQPATEFPGLSVVLLKPHRLKDSRDNWTYRYWFGIIIKTPFLFTPPPAVSTSGGIKAPCLPSALCLIQVSLYNNPTGMLILSPAPIPPVLGPIPSSGLFFSLSIYLNLTHPERPIEVHLTVRAMALSPWPFPCNGELNFTLVLWNSENISLCWARSQCVRNIYWLTGCWSQPLG